MSDEKDPFIMYARANQPKETKPRKKRNKSPEKSVQYQVKDWMDIKGWSMHVVESKATFNPTVGRYLTSNAVPGMSDLIGNTPQGIAAFVELKAPGKRSTIRPAQRKFIEEKIKTNAFAVIIDSVALLEEIYFYWSQLHSFAERQLYLTRCLP